MKTSIIQQSRSLGKEIWTRELRLAKVEKDKRPGEEEIRKYFGTLSMDDFYERIGQGELPLQDIHRFLTGGNSLPKEMALRFFPTFGKRQEGRRGNAPADWPGNKPRDTLRGLLRAPPGRRDCGRPPPANRYRGPQQELQLPQELPDRTAASPSNGAPTSSHFTTHLTIETDNRKNITFDMLKELKDARTCRSTA